MFDTKVYEEKFSQALDYLHEELKKIRTGRAHVNQLDGVMVEAYGVAMPLNQVASVSAPEAQMLLITPFDPTNIPAISASIRNDQALGLNPSDDGRVVRVPVPSLTEERRHQIVKQASEKTEDAKIVLRNIRQDAFKEIKRLKEAKDLSEDDAKRLEKEIDRQMSELGVQIEQIFKDKQKEILTI